MQPFNVLAVDDDRRYLDLMKRAFEKEGHNLHCAASAEDALSIKELHRFDLVITDFDLGKGMNGLAFAKLMIEKMPGIPVIMVTGSTLPGLPGSAEKIGVSKLLTKPVVFSEIMEIITSSIGAWNEKRAEIR